jgi:hypothetical protein
MINQHAKYQSSSYYCESAATHLGKPINGAAVLSNMPAKAEPYIIIYISSLFSLYFNTLDNINSYLFEKFDKKLPNPVRIFPIKILCH